MIIEVRDEETGAIVSSQHVWLYVLEDLFIGKFRYNGKVKVFADGVEIPKPAFAEDGR